QIVRQSAERCGRKLQLLERRQQAPDHPIHPTMPETAYLKLGVFRVL
ncbi:MAG: RlmI/RlmK family 23S rRNA methyltransferase, partial [Acidobacteriota bacterium]